MESILHDVRYAVRLLKRSPGFTLVAALTVALGIGATTTIFSAINAVLLKPPPGVRDAGELVRVYRVAEDGSSYHEFSYPNYLEYRAADTGLGELAATAVAAAVISDESEPEMLVGILVSDNFFRMLGVRPALGRFFADDRAAAAERVVVLGHGTWSRQFGRDSTIVGRTVQLNRVPFTVIGVSEEGFRGPNAMLEVGVWLPIEAAPALMDGIDLNSRTDTWIDPFGRRAPGVSIEQAEAALNRVSANLRAEYPEGSPDHGIDVQPYRPVGTRAFGAAMGFSLFLFLIAGTVLLIACLNVGGVLLARATQRGKEMAMRLALGAGRRRVVRQLLTESILLFALGGAGGSLIALYVTRLMSAYQLPIDVPLAFDFAPDMRALAFTLAVALLTGLTFGLAPALHVTKPDLQSILRAGSAAGGAPRSRLRSAFVVTQVAGSALLLIGAGLFARGLARVDSVNLGFEPDGVHVLSFEMEYFGYSPESATAFYRDLVERAAQLPEVESLAATDMLPVTLGGRSSAFEVVGRAPTDEETRPQTDLARVTPAYFETMRIPLTRGRPFSAADREGALPVAIVNQTFARRNWPDDSALGKRIRLDGAELEIVGVARNAKYRTLTEEPRAMVYVSYEQWPTTSPVVLARLEHPGANVAGALRGIVRELDDTVPIDANLPYRELMGIVMLPSRAAALFTTVFGGLGLLLAALGLYGILAFQVAQRTREFGIRMALGAGTDTLRALVIRGGLKLVGIGLAIGLGLALVVTRLVRGLLYGVSPTDPITFAAIALLLVGVALAASYLPAWRATRVDPVEALRAE
ncbi:MAG: ABC transporter permease [Gemmatimonadota bacterium]|nr:MAG: ABC transporter permease [Gemmatimonadota bacterium]